MAEKDGELAKALSYLDRYESAGAASDFSDAEQLRTSISYDLRNRRQSLRQEVAKAVNDNRFLRASEASVNGLRLDPDDPVFFYQAGVNAAIMWKPVEAKRLLERYLKASDSLAGDPKQRHIAMSVLGRRSSTSDITRSDTRTTTEKSWVSGADLQAGVFYDSVSLAFQPRIALIRASKNLTVTFQWNNGQLGFVESKFENRHTGRNIFSAVMEGAAAYGGGPVSMTTLSADREVADFNFKYYDDNPQVLQVSGAHSETSGGFTTSTVQAQGNAGGAGPATVTDTDHEDATESHDSSEIPHICGTTQG